MVDLVGQKNKVTFLPENSAGVTFHGLTGICQVLHFTLLLQYTQLYVAYSCAPFPNVIQINY